LPVFVCLLARLLKNVCMDFNEMLRVDRCQDMDELINFEPDPDHSLDAGTGLLSPISYRLQNFTALPRLKARCAGILRWKNPTYTYGRCGARASRGFKMVLFTEPLEDFCRR